MKLLMSNDDEAEHEENVTEAAQANGPSYGQPDISIYDCFAWPVEPFVSSFRELAQKPLHGSKITLDALFNSDSYDCWLRAVDGCLELGPIDAVQAEPAFIPENLSPDSRTEFGTPARPSLPSSHCPNF